MTKEMMKSNSTMELKEFIKTSLTEIVEGVKLSENELKNDALLRYHTTESYNNYPSVTFKESLKERQAPITTVDFKVKVQVAEGLSADGKVKANILNVLGGAASSEHSQSNATTQELAFSLPLIWKNPRK